MVVLGSVVSQGCLYCDDVYMLIMLMFYVYVWGLFYVVMLMGIKQVYFGCYLFEWLLELVVCEKVMFLYCVLIILYMLLGYFVVVMIDF